MCKKYIHRGTTDIAKVFALTVYTIHTGFIQKKPCMYFLVSEKTSSVYLEKETWYAHERILEIFFVEAKVCVVQYAKGGVMVGFCK